MSWIQKFSKKKEKSQREPAGRIRPTPAHRPAPASASSPARRARRGRPATGWERHALAVAWPAMPGERAPPRPSTPEMGRASSHFAHALAQCALLALSRSRRVRSCSAHRHRDARRRRCARPHPRPRPLKPRLRTLELRHHLRHPFARFPPLSSSVRRPIWPVLPHRHGRDSASSRATTSPPPCSLSFSLCARTGAARPRIESQRAQSRQCARNGHRAVLVGALLRCRAAMHAAENLQRPTHTPNLRARSASHSHARCAPRRSQPAPETAAAPPCRPPERRPPPRPGQGGSWAEGLSLAAATACWAGPCARVSPLFLFFGFQKKF